MAVRGSSTSFHITHMTLAYIYGYGYGMGSNWLLLVGIPLIIGLIAQFRARVPGQYPPLLVNSIDLTRMIGLIGAGELESVTAYLAAEVVRLARAGADFALFATVLGT